MNILDEFSQTVLIQEKNSSKGFFPIFSNNFLLQKKALDYITKSIQHSFDGFLIYKNNIFPQDNLNELDKFLKPKTIIIINQISNSFQYKELISLAQNNIIIAGFECFSSSPYHYNDFILKFHQITRLNVHELKKHINVCLFCEADKADKDYNTNLIIDYKILS